MATRYGFLLVMAGALALGAMGCGGGLTLYYRGTSAEAGRTAPVTADGTCALESGEVLDLGPILKVEGHASEVVVTRKLGRYFITADAFRNVWVVTPSGRLEATAVAVDPTPKDKDDRIGGPTLDARNDGICVRVKFMGPRGVDSVYVTDKADLAPAACLTEAP